MLPRAVGWKTWLAVFLCSAGASMAGTWLYTQRHMASFMERGYVNWMAKTQLVNGCDLGDVVVLGNSLGEAAIDPLQMSLKTSNLGVGAATPIEVHFWVDRMLRCPTLPKHIVITLGASDMGNVSRFTLENGARFGYIDFDFLEDIHRQSHRLMDTSFDALRTNDGLTGTLRNAYYASGAPPIYFSALMKARVNGRLDANSAALQELLQKRGHVNYSNRREAAAEAFTKPFKVIPIQDYYLSAAIDRLTKAGSAVHFLATPRRQASNEEAAKAFDAQFSRYLDEKAKRHPGLNVANASPQIWPDEFFADSVHLNPKGAAVYSRFVDRCLQNWGNLLNSTDP